MRLTLVLLSIKLSRVTLGGACYWAQIWLAQTRSVAGAQLYGITGARFISSYYIVG